MEPRVRRIRQHWPWFHRLRADRPAPHRRLPQVRRCAHRRRLRPLPAASGSGAHDRECRAARRCGLPLAPRRRAARRRRHPYAGPRAGTADHPGVRRGQRDGFGAAGAAAGRGSGSLSSGPCARRRKPGLSASVQCASPAAATKRSARWRNGRNPSAARIAGSPSRSRWPKNGGCGWESRTTKTGWRKKCLPYFSNIPATLSAPASTSATMRRCRRSRWS